MFIKVDSTGTVENLKKSIKEVVGTEGINGIMILACDENGFTPKDVDGVLKDCRVPVFGGIFPAIIHGKTKFEKGTIVAGLNSEPTLHIIPQLSDMSVEYEDIIDEEIANIGITKTIFVLVDGFAKRISALIDSLFNVFGLEINYIGGGAGSLSFEQKPCLFTNEGLIMDSGLLIMLEMESGVGVSHGWNDVRGPFRVTESDRNVIKTLDWRPAFEVYREIVEEHSGKTFTDDNFFDIAKAYPFGISKLGTEKIVRDPLMTGDNDSLVCVGEVPEGSYVHILNGDLHSLVQAAARALALGKDAYNSTSAPGTTLFIDCISRVLFLQDEFSQEIDAVYQENFPLIGALTIGEIANSGKDYLEFYNKTAVVGILEE
ncbi:FIST C-terminal domain-containing protein [bacterium]|nr:FIST C-terminal domain-containing protein [bacterium]